MSFSAIFPNGLTDDSSTITATQAEALDSAVQDMIDGAGGGTVAPSTAIQIDGAGLGCSNLQDTTIGSGESLTRHTQGHYPILVDDSTLSDTATVQAAGMAADVWVMPASHSNNVTIRLSVSTGVTPVTGDVIEVIRTGTATGTFDIDAEDAPGTVIASFPTSYTNQQSGTPFSARFYFNGTTWKRLRFTADVSP